MPNDCYNSLTVKGKHERLQEFYGKYVSAENGVEDHFDFDRVYATPQRLLYCDGPGLLEWSLKYWGTKWNSYDTQITFDYGNLCLTFYTAWDPCIPIVEKLIEDHPELSFEFYYEEPGNDFSGELKGESGIITHRLHGECQSDGNEENWDEDEEDDE